MPDRQWFCWKVEITYRCGCIETTPTHHGCSPGLKCNAWIDFKTLEKDCEQHQSTGLQA
ncbi:hypothetical protein GQ53DRAFT_747906 [Thozetella sp. PMI_491]|nr:hypothetical protein GQ53DRAFT_747906 [Thozetella sp. PMI_491]